MPSYRDRRGRFTTRSIWEALFPPETPSETPRSSGGIPNWNENPVPWGELWSSQTWDEATSKWIGDLVPLDLDALADAEYLGGEYRVVFSVPDNPDYPRGFAMSEDRKSVV